MNIRTLVVALVLGLILIFAGLNWAAFTQPTTLNLLFTKVEAPLGLVMLGVVLFLTLLYVLFSLGVEASALLEIRRYARELYQTRKALEDEENSRFTKLRRYLEEEFAELKKGREELVALINQRHEELGKRLDELKAQIDERAEGLKADIKEEFERLATQIETLKLQHREISQRIEASTELLRAELREHAAE